MPNQVNILLLYRKNLLKYFVKGYQALNIPQTELSYVAGLQHIKSADGIKKQLDFFMAVKAQLPGYKTAELTPSQQQDRELITYETALNLQRLTLEQAWIKNPPAKISTEGIYTIPNGKAWYAYLLKRWVNDEVNPDQIYQFGLAEVERVKVHIEVIRKQTGLSEDDFYSHLNDPAFFITDPKEVQRSFEHTKEVVYSNLSKLFNVIKIPDLVIKRGARKDLAQTPGYYDNNTFYYNLFDKPYNKRDFGWLFIHEGVPGHHYQLSTFTQTKVSPIRQLFFYQGFAEGWAAYTEEMGKELGAYPTPYDELGKWQWDIVRSVRVPLDVALNYYGWTDLQALDFWKKNIRGQDAIAMREIARIRRWPAQVVTYKYGALQILRWKEAWQKEQGKDFDIKEFHDRVLNYGSLPLFMVKENVFKAIALSRIRDLPPQVADFLALGNLPG
jgi:uncharacterized protein (DUF885 family)